MSMTEDRNAKSEYRDGAAEEIDDDFLYYLYQGGEMLRANRVEEARDHLEKAFTLKPANPRGLNLLGLVYFKLGLFDLAIEAYRKLLENHGEDVTLRVNLATVFFKAQRMEGAEQELRQALALDADHQNAHRYLGLVLSRKGRMEEAQEHFIQAGVKNIEALIGEQVDYEIQHERSRQVESEALNAVAAGGVVALDKKEIPFQHAQQKDSSVSDLASLSTRHPVGLSEDWQAREVGKVPRSRLTASRPFLLDGNALVVHCETRIFCRMQSVVWLQGDLELTQINKRFGGQQTQHPFDTGDRSMLLVEGRGQIRISGLPGECFLVCPDQGKPAYYIEPFVCSFSDIPVWENGRLSSAKGSDLQVFHVGGDGQVVLRCPQRVVQHFINSREVVRLPCSRLVGWCGEFVPRLFESEPPLPEEIWVELVGYGEILLMEK
jgi:hypothetical protein